MHRAGRMAGKKNNEEGNLNIHSVNLQWNTYLNPFYFIAVEAKTSFKCLSTYEITWNV
jgi:hypothetical protein